MITGIVRNIMDKEIVNSIREILGVPTRKENQSMAGTISAKKRENLKEHMLMMRQSKRLKRVFTTNYEDLFTFDEDSSARYQQNNIEVVPEV